MGRPKPLKLSNGREWPTRTLALEHFREMLRRYSVGERVEEQADASDLAALLQHYDSVLAPGQLTKAGVGIAHFFVKQNTGVDNGFSYSTPGFHVMRTDGTSIDFSFYEAVRAQ